MATPPSDKPVPADYPKLLSLAVHEMRTPISVVAGYLRMILTDTATPMNERHRRMIGEAEKGCTRLVEILAELSDLGKLDAGTAVVQEDTIDLFELIHAVALAVHEPLDREVTLAHQGPTTGAPFVGDKARLTATLTVIARAVVREQPSGTRVVVHVDRTTRNGRIFARVTVAPEPDLSRASASEPREFDDRRGGLGLGLPLARRVVARYGGHIWSPVPDDGQPLPIGSRGAIVLQLPLN